MAGALGKADLTIQKGTFTGGEVLQFNQFNPAKNNISITNPNIISTQLPDTTNLDEVVSNHIERVLEISNSRIHGQGGAADLLGINPSTLRNRMNKLGIVYKKSGR